MATEYFTWILAISSFAFIMTFTPGPNNIMLATSGANFGIRRSMPHVWGVAFGFPAMLLVVATGMGYILDYPVLRLALRIIGIVYIFYLAYVMATMSQLSKQGVKTPLTFLQAALFQWVNPKAWAQAVGASSAYLSIHFDKTLQIIAMAAVFLPIGVASSYIWAIFGSKIARLLNNKIKLRTFNICMALALLVTVIPVILSY
ncbi:MAG: LysE family translocator [Marinobacter sp.]|uniref:LysE family translocator n=1 Tax=Marinobacter sp. TaxID=50741 RepID=UPI0034A02B55